MNGCFLKRGNQVFLSAHYSGEDLVPKFKAGEAWKKVFGPVFIYLNSSDNEDNLFNQLWEDAKLQVSTDQDFLYHIYLRPFF